MDLVTPEASGLMNEPGVLINEPEAGRQLIGSNVQALRRRQVVEMEYCLGNHGL